jgi:hypothetical protein
MGGSGRVPQGIRACAGARHHRAVTVHPLRFSATAEPGREKFLIHAAEEEKLAIDEHNRWCRKREAEGWRLRRMPDVGDELKSKRLPEEARRRKESPYLIQWEDLLARYPDIAEYDRIFVRSSLTRSLRRACK